MPATASPEYAQDFITQLAAVSGGSVIITDGATRNVWAGRERTTEETPIDAVFVQEFGGVADLHNDGRLHRAGINVLVRASTYQAGLTLAKHVHDKMDLTQFTVSGRRYIDCRAETSGPDHIETEDGTSHEFFAESFSLWYEQL